MLKGWVFFPGLHTSTKLLNPKSLLGFCPVTLKKCTEPCHEALSRTKYEVTLACFSERCSSLGRPFLPTVYISHKKEQLMVTQHRSRVFSQSPVDKAGGGAKNWFTCRDQNKNPTFPFCCVP